MERAKKYVETWYLIRSLSKCSIPFKDPFQASARVEPKKKEFLRPFLIINPAAGLGTPSPSIFKLELLSWNDFHNPESANFMVDIIDRGDNYCRTNQQTTKHKTEDWQQDQRDEEKLKLSNICVK